MIREYAIDPEAFCEFSKERLKYRLVLKYFAEGTQRFMVTFPQLNNWKTKVREASRLHDDMAQKRTEELLTKFTLSTQTIRRSIPDKDRYDGTRSWLENAEKENCRCRFDAILATHNPNNVDNILLSSLLEDWPDAYWKVPNEIAVNRTTDSMVEAVTPLLEKAREIIFVDPYFSPFNSYFIDPFIAMVDAAVHNPVYSARKRIEYHVSDNKLNPEELTKGCRRELPRKLPDGQSVLIKQWKERKDGETLHNRYILTELGGVRFGHGLDKGKNKRQTDEINFLSRGSWVKRWGQYASENGEFEKICDFIIVGEKIK